MPTVTTRRPTFTGGLNLRADQFNLARNESPALLNVDVDPRGGVSRRDAIDVLNTTALADTIYSLFQHSDASNNQIIAAVKSSSNSKLYWNDNASGNFQSGAVESDAAVVQFAGSQRPQAVTFNDTTYVVNGSLLASEGTKSAVAWAGSNNCTTLTPDIDGSAGHFPCARYAATWAEFVWVAYTLESGTSHKNRVRFSAVNDGENWTASDYIDIDIGEDGDYITAIIPDADRLLVFKQNSVYAIYGFSRDSFEVRNITRAAGCRNGTSPVASTVGIFSGMPKTASTCCLTMIWRGRLNVSSLRWMTGRR